jgi:hypothetical protein
MDVSGVSPAAVPDPGMTAWAADAGSAEVRAGTTVVQAVAKPPTSAGEAPKTPDATLPRATHALSEFALPAAQLVPAMLIGLQVEATTGWPLQHPGGHAAATPPESAPPAPQRETSRQHDDAEPDAQPSDESKDDAHAQAETTMPARVVMQDTDADAIEMLTRALRRALAAPAPPQALLAAAEQWQRGRCVVLACPQGDDPAGPAWAFVLWPRRPRVAHGAAPHVRAALTLVGVRVEARLHWSLLSNEHRWWHVRVMKEHHPRGGRQLIAIDEASAPDAPPRVACEVQLGPALSRPARNCDVRVRIPAVQRFWNALDTQWSVHVLVCSRPLAGARAADVEEDPSSC